jgi:hypothetical protein
MNFRKIKTSKVSSTGNYITCNLVRKGKFFYININTTLSIYLKEKYRTIYLVSFSVDIIEISFI